MLREIGLCSDHGKASIGTNPHRHHVLGDLLAESNAGIGALSRDVNEATFHVDLDFDVRVFRHEVRELGAKNGDRWAIPRGDPNGSGGLLTKLIERRQFLLDFLNCGTQNVTESPSSEGKWSRPRSRPGAKFAARQMTRAVSLSRERRLPGAG